MWAAAYVAYVSAKVSACHITASLFLPQCCLLSPSIVVFFKWKRYDLLIMDLALSGYNSILLKPTMQGQLCGKISRDCQLIPVLPLSHTGRRLLNKHVNECRCLGRCNWLRGGGWSITWSRGLHISARCHHHETRPFSQHYFCALWHAPRWMDGWQLTVKQ